MTIETEHADAGIWDLHQKGCALSSQDAWAIEDEGLGYTATDDCTCESVTADLPHPGISDEFWAEIPEADRRTFSAYLVQQVEIAEAEEVRAEAIRRISEALDVPLGVLAPGPTEESVLTAVGGWTAPSESIYGLGIPEITARRGGLAFTAPRWPKPLAEWSKKELRAEIARLQDVLDKTQRRRRKAERKVERLLRIVRRLA